MRVELTGNIRVSGKAKWLSWPCNFRWIAVAALSFVSVSAQATDSRFSELLSFKQDSLRWHEPIAGELFGVPVQWRSFTAGISVPKTAQTLAQRTDLFQRVLALKDRIVLSGSKSGWHWVAEISPAPAGASGLVSALHVGGSQLERAFDQRGQLKFEWLPLQARARFSQRQSHRGLHVVQRVYDLNLSVERLTIQVQRNLRTLGWVPDLDLVSSPGTSAWRRDVSRLILFAHGSHGRSTLFVHHLE